MNIVGPPLGKVAVVPADFPEWNTNQAVVVYRTGPQLFSQFLAMSLRTNAVLSALLKTSKTTAGQVNLSLTASRGVLIPVPPLAEQHAIVAEVERRLSVVDRTESQITIELKRAARLRQSILKRAFEGKLVPQDPNDEPASVLLERMRGNSTAVETRASTTPARSPSAARGMERSARRRPGKR